MPSVTGNIPVGAGRCVRLEASIEPDRVSEVPGLAAEAERLGFDGLLFRETKHDPFAMLALAAASTRRVRLGTAIVVAFARSPTVVAHSAWDVQSLSGGRFALGLGTQVRAHIERRFGMRWESPLSRMREYITALREVWRAWQTGRPPQFRGKHYRIDLTSWYFDPGPIEHPEIPVYVAAVNRGMCRLAGELCDGVHVHPLNSPRYIREVMLPAIREGAERAGRRPEEVKLSATVFTAIGSDDEEVRRSEELVRRMIAFYASTPAYRTILALYGWERVGEELSGLAREGKWDEMARLVDDEMMREFSVSGRPSRVAQEIVRRYRGLLESVSVSVPFDGRSSWWPELVRSFRSSL
ncbi:MAG: TIGR03617 family F420-dependent LLM class oxidoreductase [Nitrososphaerota archaeon]|nr:TIGR03617 family F420-dependent LLM class oxidoreductase [Candidatus Calditenuis fumarioli]